jgi:hypothetical protein
MEREKANTDHNGAQALGLLFTSSFIEMVQKKEEWIKTLASNSIMYMKPSNRMYGQRFCSQRVTGKD